VFWVALHSSFLTVFEQTILINLNAMEGTINSIQLILMNIGTCVAQF
jgi:hypothetical protein